MNTRNKQCCERVLDQLAKDWPGLEQVNNKILSMLQEVLGIEQPKDEPPMEEKVIDEHLMRNAFAMAISMMQDMLPLLSRCGGYVTPGDEESFMNLMFPAYPVHVKKVLAHDMALRNQQLHQSLKPIPLAEFVELLCREEL